MNEAMPGYCPHDIADDPVDMGLIEGHFECRFGRLRYVRTERHSNTVTLYLHGVGGSWQTWTPLMTELAQSERITDSIFIDIPGFGQSENITNSLPGELVGEELVSLVTSLGWSKIRLVGHSMGGFLCLMMASRLTSAPIVSVQVVSGTYNNLVIVTRNPVRHIADRPRLVALLFAMRLLALLDRVGLGPRKSQLIRRFVASISAKGAAHPDLLVPSVQEALADGVRPASFLRAARNAFGYEPSVEWAKIGVPWQAIFGRQDGLVTSDDLAFVRRVGGEVHVDVIEDCGHFAPVERPSELARLLVKWQ